jgi:hypothetical protein
LRTLAILLALGSGTNGPAWRADLAVGAGGTVSLGPTRTSAGLAFFAPRWSYSLSPRVDYLVEGNFSRYLSPDGWFVGVVPLGARFSTGAGRRRWYFAAGAGLGWTDLDGRLPELDRRFNFLLEGGLGVEWREAARGKGRYLEVRLVHLSNGGTAGRNLGLNALALVGGWRVR